MQRMQIDLGHKPPNDPSEPIPYFTEAEAQAVRQQLSIWELERLERNVRDHLAELAHLP